MSDKSSTPRRKILKIASNFDDKKVKVADEEI